jgi:hypothetical protein
LTCAGRVVAARARFGADDFPRANLVAHAAEPHRPKIAPLEQIADLPPGFSRDHDRIRLRDPLQACGEIGRFARDIQRMRRDFAMQVPNHDEAGRDSDARLQAAIAVDLQRADALDRFQRGMNRALGVVFMRFRITEIMSAPSPTDRATWPSNSRMAPVTDLGPILAQITPFGKCTLRRVLEIQLYVTECLMPNTLTATACRGLVR